MNNMAELLDDKTLVIFAVLILGLFSLFFLEDPAAVVNSIVSGLFGVAVGKSVK